MRLLGIALHHFAGAANEMGGAVASGFGNGGLAVGLLDHSVIDIASKHLINGSAIAVTKVRE